MSIWKQTSELPEFSELKSDIKTDVLIIGGGLAGILTAYKLKENGVDCVVVEKDRICRGVTANTTAKITSQHGFCYHQILKSNGLESAKAYLKANESALSEYERLCKNIDCDFQKKDNFVYSRNDASLIDKELKALREIGYSAQFQEKLPIPVDAVGAIKFKNQYQFNPLKFVSEIVKDLKIYENTFIKKIDKYSASTEKVKISFEKAVIATHFPIVNNHGLYFMKMYQHRSYVISLKNAPDVDGMYVDENDKGFSFRNYNNLLLLGGGSHKTGKDGGCYKELCEFAKDNYPNSVEVSRWATQDCMTLDSIPYIGPYFKNSDNWFVVTGFNKWGMSNSMVGAEILCDMICGEKNEFSQTFDPSRSILKPQLFINGFESVKNLLTPTSKRCPHLGCALKWNKQEHTWDCPCHGSRFSEDGKLIDNPANGDLS
ncbi:MAG: FAD-dependent oxidoreductase [Acutalibacteraceae bacterium]